MAIAPKTLVHSYSVPEFEQGEALVWLYEEYPWETSGFEAHGVGGQKLGGEGPCVGSWMETLERH